MNIEEVPQWPQDAKDTQRLLDDAMSYHLDATTKSGADASAGAVMSAIVIPQLLAYIQCLKADRWSLKTAFEALSYLPTTERVAKEQLSQLKIQD